jgi:hypothetical protein
MPNHKIIAVTPAGRRAYLELLGYYILRDSSIHEWHLWDNCRLESDRVYINQLADKNEKIKIVRLNKTDGTNRAINQFYQLSTSSDTFYIKMDDDLVYLPDGFGESFYAAALKEKGKYSYWSPLVINNALCSWLIKHHSQMKIDANLMASAACSIGWRSPNFAHDLHAAFLDALETGNEEKFSTPNFDISLARFSINCIGFWGEDVQNLGEGFCPLNVDDEEWISAILPSRTGKPGRIFGNLIVSHFSFFTQEDELLKTDILARYFMRTGLSPIQPPRKKTPWRKYIRRIVEQQLSQSPSSFLISAKTVKV